MKQATIFSYEELPLFLNAKNLSQLLGISLTSSYELMHGEAFPVLYIGGRMLVPREKFMQWAEDRVRESEEVGRKRSSKRGRIGYSY